MADVPVGGRFDDTVRRLHALHPRLIDLSLDRVQRLLGRLGHPEDRLPPVIHVAGTNGKGSTCAFLRAIAEAAGQRVHVFTSPHLVAFNERIRIAGTLVDDAALADMLEHVERANGGDTVTVFEVITAAALQLFSEVAADLCVLEVGLGGRLDATNVVARPAACAIASISMDHRDFLGDDLAGIAAEKAGILKAGVPAVTGAQECGVLAVLDARAKSVGATLAARGRDWSIAPEADGLVHEGLAHDDLVHDDLVHDGPVHDGLVFRDAGGSLRVPLPGLPGAHQIDNAGIAIAALRVAGLAPGAVAVARGLAEAAWPARLQRLRGRLAASLPPGWELWLDGGHNAGAAAALAAHVQARWRDRPVVLVVGMKQSKDVSGFLTPLLALGACVFAVAEPGQHLAVPVEAIVAASGGIARPGPTIASALSRLPRPSPPGRVLICGSLYLAGEALKADGGAIG